ncbi:MAG: hypothetical protein ACI4XE_09220 [Acutalibacteraceae bacterium]
MKKRFFSLSAILIVLCSLFTMTSCRKTSYGDVFDSKEKLSEEMAANGLDFKYPENMGTETDGAEHQYIAVRDAKSGKYTGYKIYCFGSPFYTSVTSFDLESDALLSDEESRTPFLTDMDSECGTIKVYAGKGHKDALYLIGCINIDSKHYEVRVTCDEEMKDNLYVHAIYKDNEFYNLALKTVTSIVENIR